MILLKNCSVYSPFNLGKKDILLSYDKILGISSPIDPPKDNFPSLEVIDLKNKTVIPGLIDLHVHMIGGGGEGGFTTRTPELNISGFFKGGITTAIGLLGTDAVTRSLPQLLSKARALDEEGLCTYIWTGSYELPTRILTQNPRSDIILIDKIIGIGELAVSDHRSSNPQIHELIHIASEARVGGLLSGKCGILHIHLGDGKLGLKPVLDIFDNSDIPYENILPTHVNRNPKLFNEAIKFGKKGGYFDITSGINKDDDGGVAPDSAYISALESSVNKNHITMSSDGGGSKPSFDENGKLLKLGVADLSSQFKCLKGLLSKDLKMEDALLPFTFNPANLLKLPKQG
ncbi:MAG: beta-aspartyl-peptidase, partial [Oscillospiraceae bacterium]|nr:beta-aspartyl-peptidase [Oscillospiraceae bacterium]